MKILLIYPYFINDRIQGEEISVPPMGIYYVAAVLKDNHYEVEILNWHQVNKTPEKIKEVLNEKRPDVIGFSILNANRWGGIEIARIAKQMNPEVKIVFGGIGATFLWGHFLTHFPEIDFIVLGEGEYTFLNLIKATEKADYEKLEKIRGIAFRKNGRPLKTKDAGFIQDLDSLPDPAKYFRFHHLSATRGCAWKCTFCGSPQFWGRKIRSHSPRYFLKQLERLCNKGITFFYISDDTFTANKNNVIELCRGIIEKNLKITWYAISRVDHVNDDILYWMRKAGCIQISYGVESGSEKIRATLNKSIKREQVKKAFSLTTKYGILARAYFIYGSPGETWETIQETIDLIHEIKPLSVIFYILDIFPGTELYKGLQRKLNIDDDIWLNKIEGIMYFESDPNLTDELILAFGKKLRTDYYENIHTFTKSIDLAEKKDLYEMHSDFYSRLGMTFSHGDYSKIDTIKEKDHIAEELYKKSLRYYPNHRAYLGIGIIRQRKREPQESIKVLLEGIGFFPESEELNLCLGINYMNLKEFEKALSYFSKFPDSKEANYFTEICYKEMANSRKVS